MTLAQALAALPALRDELAPDLGRPLERVLDEAGDRIRWHQADVAHARSEWTYWLRHRHLSYWRAVRSLVAAAIEVGADRLPEVELRPADMARRGLADRCWDIEDFGQAVLHRARYRPGRATERGGAER